MDKTFKFKTTLKCNGCVAKIKPLLDGMKNVVEWSVDLTTSDRILTVTINDENIAVIKQKIVEAGYKVEDFER